MFWNPSDLNWSFSRHSVRDENASEIFDGQLYYNYLPGTLEA
jgi:hypothetical protein